MVDKITYLICLLLIVNCTYGNNNVFVLTGESEDINLPNQSIAILADTVNYNFDEILSLDEELFQTGNKENVFVHSSKTTCWVKFKLKNTSTTIDNWYLELPNWGMSFVDVYIENQHKEFDHFEVGAARKASQKNVEHKNYLFNLPNLDQEKQIYLKLKSNYPFPMQFWVRSNNLIVNYSSKEYALLGIFYGILGSLAIFNLLLFVVQRKSINLFYVLYIITCMILCTSEDGLGFQYIWPEFPQLNSFFYNYISLIYIVAFSLYLNSFLKLSKTQPQLFKVMMCTGITLFACSLFSAETGNYQTVGIFIPLILLFIIAAFRTKKNKYVPTIWLSTALIFSLIGMSILILRYKGYIDFGSLSRFQLIMIIYAMNVTFVFEAILFAIAIVKRLKLENIISKNAISRSEKRFRKIFESSFDASIFYNVRQGKIIDVNNKALTLFKKSKSDLIGSNIIDLINLNTEVETFYKSMLTDQILEIPNDLISFETTGVKSNSELFDCEVSISPVEHLKEKFVIINIKNVTIRNTAEKKLADQIATIQNKNVQLEQYINSNSELESFAYIASHDIKQPLRTIKSFSKLLQQHLDKNNIIDKNSKQYLEFIQSSVANLETLTTDILEHSRVSSSKNSAYETEDLNDILSIIEQNLNQLIFENNVQIKTINLPKQIKLTKTKIIQLFQNIISNAIKFRKKDQPCTIKITGIEKADCWKFEIQDNGIGIKKEHFERIFQVFSKLHASSEYQGSGIGLATCKKIIDLHDGKIWVESEYGIGTTFHFTISKNISLSLPIADEEIFDDLISCSR